MTDSPGDVPRIAVLPAARPDRPSTSDPTWLADAVRAGGAQAAMDADDLAGVEAIVWTDPHDPGDLRDLLDRHPGIRWVQLPFAGVEPFLDVLDTDRVWTCGKGVYAEPVAEAALALALGVLRNLDGYARATSWSAPAGRNLLGARVTVLGGGEITASLLRLLGPWGCTTTVVTRRPRPLAGADRVVGGDELLDVLPDTDVLVLALALTPETERVVDATALAALPDHAVLVNVARGRHVDTDALVDALRSGRLAGAGLDVTDPEPLPDGHPLWTLPGVLITPHTANTPEMGRPLLAARVTENVRRFLAGDDLVGGVDVDAGY
ncbi:MAG: D-isomer specific 2-hydroxyacid dehydrogenase family protein [Actinomycetes bacterium]